MKKSKFLFLLLLFPGASDSHDKGTGEMIKLPSVAEDITEMKLPVPGLG